MKNENFINLPIYFLHELIRTQRWIWITLYSSLYSPHYFCRYWCYCRHKKTLNYELTTVFFIKDVEALQWEDTESSYAMYRHWVTLNSKIFKDISVGMLPSARRLVCERRLHSAQHSEIKAYGKLKHKCHLTKYYDHGFYLCAFLLVWSFSLVLFKILFFLF